MESKSGILLGQNSDPAFLEEGPKSQLHNLIPSEKRYKIGSSSTGKCLTVTQVGMRSHLFRTKIRCFQGFSFFRYVSMLLERVPMGSRASSTWMMTSEESITYYNEKIIRC